MKDIYFIILLLLTALGSSIATSYAPIMLTRLKRLFSRKKRPSNIDELVKRVNELEEQLDNVAKNHYRREQNRRNNIRRDVREYLNELRNG